MAQPIPAIVTAGDRGAARAVHGRSKVYLELEGRPLVAHVVLTLQHVPEVSSVWVVGDRERLEAALRTEEIAARLTKPLHIVEQFENLYQNCWQTFRRTLPGAPPDGRDPAPDSDEDTHWQVLYLSADLPFITPEEVSEFVREGQRSGCDYGLGLSRERSLAYFHPVRSGGLATPGQLEVDVTYFNLREDRFKQNNLHLARPVLMGNRHYVQDMYEHRKQREIGSQLGLAVKLFRGMGGDIVIVFFYGLMHLAGVLDRGGHRRLADFVRRATSIERVARAIGRIMDTRFAFVIPLVGGCAIDVDTEEEYDAICARYGEWREQQQLYVHALAASAPGDEPKRLVLAPGVGAAALPAPRGGSGS